MTEEELRKRILDTAEDIPAHFLYYDRKGDDGLPVGVIEKAITDGIVTIEEILAPLRRNLTK